MRASACTGTSTTLGWWMATTRTQPRRSLDLFIFYLFCLLLLPAPSPFHFACLSPYLSPFHSPRIEASFRPSIPSYPSLAPKRRLCHNTTTRVVCVTSPHPSLRRRPRPCVDAPVPAQRPSLRRDDEAEQRKAEGNGVAMAGGGFGGARGFVPVVARSSAAGPKLNKQQLASRLKRLEAREEEEEEEEEESAASRLRARLG